MDIEVDSHLNKKLKDRRTIRRCFGDLEDGISLALSSLELVTCLDDLTPGPPLYRHRLYGDLDGMWALRVSRNRRMILQPLDGESPCEIRSVRIIDIVDYH